MLLFPQQKKITVFVIGRPGSGKTTFARYLRRVLWNWRTVSINDYDLLLSKIPTLTPAQIRWENGQFEIIDRSVFDRLLSEIVAKVRSERGKRHIIVELARPSYSEIITQFQDFAQFPFYVFYLDTPINVCIQRNYTRAPASPSRIVPESIIRRFFATDDIELVADRIPQWTRIINNANTSLASLEREANLLVDELLGGWNGCLVTAVGLMMEFAAAIIIFSYAIFFLGAILYLWQSTNQSFIGSLAPSPDKLSLLRTVGLVMCGGGLGSTTYCMRSLYHYYILDKFDFWRFKWWYIFRPQAGCILAFAIFAIAKGGVGTIAGASSTHIATLPWFGIAFLAGFGTEQVIEWLRRASKSLFGESRVQPQDSSDN